MTKTLIAAVLLALMTSACGRIDQVYLKHPITGKVVQCGPYTGLNNVQYLGAVELQGQCVVDFRAQGFERVSGP